MHIYILVSATKSRGQDDKFDFDKLRKEDRWEKSWKKT